MSQTECATPRCREQKIEGRNFCKEHAANLDRIRQEFESDPKLLYNQRLGDSPSAKKVTRPPTCCYSGCYEIREIGKKFCFIHENEETEAA